MLLLCLPGNHVLVLLLPMSALVHAHMRSVKRKGCRQGKSVAFIWYHYQSAYEIEIFEWIGPSLNLLLLHSFSDATWNFSMSVSFTLSLQHRGGAIQHDKKTPLGCKTQDIHFFHVLSLQKCKWNKAYTQKCSKQLQCCTQYRNTEIDIKLLLWPGEYWQFI